MEDSLEELEAYREKVVLELRRREVVVRDLEVKLAEARNAVKNASRSRPIVGKSPGREHIEEAHRARLKDVSSRLVTQMRDAEAELRRAEERLVQVDRKIAEIVSKES